MIKSLDKLAAFGELVENARIARTPPNNGTIGISAYDLQILDWAFATLASTMRRLRPDGTHDHWETPEQRDQRTREYVHERLRELLREQEQ